MTQPTRPEGYYWVLEIGNNKYHPKYWTGDFWYSIGLPHQADSNLKEIGHRIPSNEEIGKMQEDIAALKHKLQICESDARISHDD